MIYNLKREMRISPVYVDVTLEEGLDGVTRVVSSCRAFSLIDIRFTRSNHVRFSMKNLL